MEHFLNLRQNRRVLSEIANESSFNRNKNLNTKPNTTRPHIAIVGRRNVGKSLLVNSLLGKEISLVSDIAGTTLNPLSQSFELAPYGPVIIVDTAGIDDDGELGQEKISETIKIISSSDFVVVVVDARETLQNKELELIAYLDKVQINYVVAVNKIEFGINPELLDELKELRIIHYEISCKEKAGIEELKRKITRLLPEESESKIFDDILLSGDTVVMVEPDDNNLSNKKLVHSHIQMISEALDKNITVIVCKAKGLKSVIDNLKSFPDLMLVDSYSFLFTVSNIPEKVAITTYSILLTKFKGDLKEFVNGLAKINQLKNGDRILIAEACLLHPTEEEMSKTKISSWLKYHTKKELRIDVIQGLDFPDNISDYDLIIHCDGCLITRRVLQTRINEARLLNIPVINYGLFASYMHGAIPRALISFNDALLVWQRIKKKSTSVF